MFITEICGGKGNSRELQWDQMSGVEYDWSVIGSSDRRYICHFDNWLIVVRKLCLSDKSSDGSCNPMESDLTVPLAQTRVVLCTIISEDVNGNFFISRWKQVNNCGLMPRLVMCYFDGATCQI